MGIKKNISLLEEIARNLKFEFYTQGKTIINQGDIGEKFYIIKAGLVEVFTSKDSTEKRLAQLGKGDYFGEIALVKDIPRTANVRTLTWIRVLTLDKDDFTLLLNNAFS